MLILTLNCGSSSLKFALYEGARGDLNALAHGAVERIDDRPTLHAQWGDSPSQEATLSSPGHEMAAQAVLDWIGEGMSRGSGTPEVIAHRVVHGGPRYRDPVLIDDDVLGEVERAGVFAGLHNAPAVTVIRAVAERAKGATQVAVFDTGFFRDLPQRTARYAIPLDMADRHGLQRYGFHGIAHRYMADAVTNASGVAPEVLRLVTLQLGSGCSAAAIAGGRPIDTTMGATPLEGLMMATRSGDVDPALPVLMARFEDITPEEALERLNRRSGLLGVSGRSADLRDLLAARTAGDERAALAIEMFCYRIRKQIGAYFAALGGAHAIVFGGGIGEHQPDIRRWICEPLAWAGLTLDLTWNASPQGATARISADSSAIEAYVVRVDEQRGIAAATLGVLGG